MALKMAYRHQSYVEYGPEVIILLVILKNICNLKSMRSMTESFNKEECIDNIKKITGVEDLNEPPHYDTVNTSSCRVDISKSHPFVNKFQSINVRDLLCPSQNRT